MSDEAFWLKIWQSIIIGIVCIAATIGGCTAHGDYLVERAIAGGADPIKVQCALRAGATNEVCVVAAITGDKR